VGNGSIGFNVSILPDGSIDDIYKLSTYVVLSFDVSIFLPKINVES
jgi:hypothetical protein